MALTYTVAIQYGRREIQNSIQVSEDFQEVEPGDNWPIKFVAACAIASFGLAGLCAHLTFAVSPIYKEHRWAVWPYLPLAKVGGYMLDFMLPLLLFPVMRHFMTWLRSSPATSFLTLDANIKAHRVLGAFVFVPIAIHVGMHLTWMALVPEGENYPAGGFVQRAFRSHHGITGWTLLVCMVLMALTSTTRVRRGKWKVLGQKVTGFDIFWNTHSLYWVVFALLFFHSESFLKWAFWPVSLFLLDKVLRSLYKHCQRSRQFLAGMVAPNILEIRVPLKHFHYKPGQWAFLCVKEISRDEWHPFTISSNPESEEVSWHMDTKGDWCSSLVALIEEQGNDVNGAEGNSPQQVAPAGDEEQGKPRNTEAMILSRLVRHSMSPTSHLKKVNLSITVDGPYGSGSEHAFDFKKIVMVSTGIGITPFMSIIKSMHARIKAEKALGVPTRAWHVPRTIYFFHVCRNRADYRWCDPVIKNLEAEDIHFKCIVFVTRPPEGDALSNYAGEHRSGRPNWDNVFDEVAAEIGPEAGEVGVFLCGSGAKDLQKICTRISREIPGTQYIFNKEVFN
eukprot:CAMPEP_0177611318 /NCGR_PEP_ID=MMETSP0419_2-20121207/20421_1 /TAXON_ID=582737 /ORGANISM="Tetraselmis sp., Strain GSL018" /LENGTH=561 /DNA_ID=CAMNT_0019107027 /DNA_START=380 /DNA_END=2065 /DNA_ORIENTATION=+